MLNVLRCTNIYVAVGPYNGDDDDDDGGVNDDDDDDDNLGSKHFSLKCSLLQAVAPLIDSPFFPGDIWRTQFVEKGFCNGYMEETACYEIGKILFGDDEKDVNKVNLPGSVLSLVCCM